MTVQGRFWWDEAEEIDLEAFERAEAEERAERARRREDLDIAAGEVERANADYDAALRKYQLAPDGLRSRRRSDLRTANARVLRAELRYAEVERQGPSGE